MSGINSLLVMDVETTGMDPEQDRIVEIGWVHLNRDLETLSSKGELVNPERLIPAEASAVHHIVDEHVSRARRKWEVLEDVPAADMYVAHNAKYEASFLPLKPWLCTYKAALRIWPDAPAHSLQVLRYWLRLVKVHGLEPDAPMHRALPDALVCTALLQELNNHASLEEMLEWSQGPSLLPKFTFGKHKNVPLAQVPVGYLRWILEQSDITDPDVRHTAEHYYDLKRTDGG